MTTNLDKFGAPVDKVICQAKETAFLDVDKQSEYRYMPVSLFYDKYRLNTTDYTKLNESNRSDEIILGDYVFRKPMRNIVEILQVEHFAHSPYAKFYAVARLAYVCPRDNAMVREKFPEFYAQHCVSSAESEKNRIVKSAPTVPYLPD